MKTVLNNDPIVSEEIRTGEVKRHATFMIGDVAAQGDINIICIGKMPKSAEPRYNRQLAEGTTQGSRHVLRTGDCFDADRSEVARLIRDATGCKIPDAYIGPVFVSGVEPAYIEHVEHEHHQLPADAVCAVVYQRSLDQEERERRVQD